MRRVRAPHPIPALVAAQILLRHDNICRLRFPSSLGFPSVSLIRAGHSKRRTVALVDAPGTLEKLRLIGWNRGWQPSVHHTMWWLLSAAGNEAGPSGAAFRRRLSGALGLGFARVCRESPPGPGFRPGWIRENHHGVERSVAGHRSSAGLDFGG